MGVHMREAEQCPATLSSLSTSDAITDPEKSVLCLTPGLSSRELGEDLWRPWGDQGAMRVWDEVLPCWRWDSQKEMGCPAWHDVTLTLKDDS